MHTIIIREPARTGDLRQRLGSALERAFRWLIDWQAQASERAHLRELSDHLLKDVGLTREQLLFGSRTRQCTTC